MGTTPLRVMTLKDEVTHFETELKVLERLCKRRWAGFTPVDMAVARLKRMVIDQTFSYTYPIKMRNNGVSMLEYQTYRLTDYLPTRRGFHSKPWDEAYAEIVLDENFPDEVMEKNINLRPFDRHIAHAAGQMLFPAGTTPIHDGDYVWASQRMMVAEYTRTWKHPVGNQPTRTKSPG